MSKFSSLNPEQEKAVKTVNGRVLVLAGAGSGKTKVIATRIAYLVEHVNVNPASILGLTFTNKAAQEMRERVASFIGAKKAKEVTLSTFHSFCVSILRKEASKIGYSANFSIYDEKDTQRVVTKILKEILSCDTLPALGPIMSAISSVKNKGIAIDDATKDPLIKELYTRMDGSLKAYNAMDFDNILCLTVKLFEKEPETLKKYQERFRFIMIDEYQDTNPIQDRIAELLSIKHNNLFVVGDDDQAIYGFRGSCIDHILKFKADVTIKLEQNYRSTQTILEAANSVIKNNTTRHNKKLWSSKISSDKIGIFHAPTELEEAQAVAEKIISIKQNQNMKWSDIAILYRSNALSRNIEAALISASWQKNGSWVRGIPYEIYGGLEFCERSEIKDVLSYLKVIANPKDQEALLRIINVPRRGISDATLEKLAQYSKEHHLNLWQTLEKISSSSLDMDSFLLQPRTLKGIIEFVETIKLAQNKFQEKPLYPTLEWFLEKINYKKAIEEEVKSDKAKLYKLENVYECINALSSYEEQNENPSLQEFITTTMLSKDNFHQKTGSDDKVQLMTFHSSKGLEFLACFLIGLEDHILPHERSQKEGGIEEERRLFYVAITRSKKFLTLSMARARRRTGKPSPSNPSRFLFEIPKNLLEVNSWKYLE
ncbi:MAG: UvrD-helicase domain-containing protein [Chlamydiae bacterium]|nr:UvrD-helicase domain-containing protein [Chlamydiota bacterium]